MFPDVVTVAQLNRLARSTIEREFPLLWVTGEVSNLTRAPSGHIYFTLKDADAQVRCAMFRSRTHVIEWRLENGQQVEARALVTLYEARGDFQLNVECLRRAGVGRLYEAFLKLKGELEGEGLFSESRKRPTPCFPSRIGVVTSPSGAALRDVVAALNRRAGRVPIIIYPTLVQGVEAPSQLAAALQVAAQRAECSLLLLVRGGGSIEDLWAFNEEIVARAISASSLPVIVGVGHESDLTIADLVADKRAATPTAAAELASAGWFEANREIAHLSGKLHSTMQARIERAMQRLDLLAKRLVRPAERLVRVRLQLADLAARLKAGRFRLIARHSHQLENLRLRAIHARPDIELARARLAQLAASLRALDPQWALGRGYAMIRSGDGRLISSFDQLAVGMVISLRFEKGSGEALVTKTIPD